MSFREALFVQNFWFIDILPMHKILDDLLRVDTQKTAGHVKFIDMILLPRH